MELKMNKKIFVVSDELCSGCRNCELWCSLVHGNEGAFNPLNSKIRIFKDAEGKVNIPTVDCEGRECSHNDKGEPLCVEMCPTGTLIYTDAEDLYQKRVELEEKKRLQPIFKLIVPWKYPYPWKPWSKEEF
jgi:Fe-S-cluster-containing hydrogenase component 2